MCTKCFNVIYNHQILNLEITIFFHSMQSWFKPSSLQSINDQCLLAINLPCKSYEAAASYSTFTVSVSGRFPGAVPGHQAVLSLLNAIAFFLFPLRVSSYLRKSLRLGIRKDCLLMFEEISGNVQTMKNRRLSKN